MDAVNEDFDFFDTEIKDFENDIDFFEKLENEFDGNMTKSFKDLEADRGQLEQLKEDIKQEMNVTNDKNMIDQLEQLKNKTFEKFKKLERIEAHEETLKDEFEDLINAKSEILGLKPEIFATILAAAALLSLFLCICGFCCYKRFQRVTLSGEIREMRLQNQLFEGEMGGAAFELDLSANEINTNNS